MSLYLQVKLSNTFREALENAKPSVTSGLCTESTWDTSASTERADIDVSGIVCRVWLKLLMLAECKSKSAL